jgi:hypothetical protein
VVRIDMSFEREISPDDEPTLSRREADVAGISPTPETVYGDSSYEPNADDHRDAERADPDEHV